MPKAETVPREETAIHVRLSPARLRSEYHKKKSESEVKSMITRGETQAAFQKQFEEDMARYSSSSAASASATTTTTTTMTAACGVTLNRKSKDEKIRDTQGRYTTITVWT